MTRKRSNEWEFQGQVVTWLNEDISRRRGLGLDRATQEPSKITAQRSDLIIWKNRASDAAFLEIELKQPTTPITSPILLRDAAEKAARWGAPYFAISNMKAVELYRTPTEGRRANPSDLLFQWPMLETIESVDDWLDPQKQELLKSQVLSVLDRAWEIDRRGEGFSPPLEASMFVDRLGQSIPKLKEELHRELKIKSKADSAVRRRLKEIAAEQGFAGFVEDIERAIAGQYAYRLVGQLLFYFALRRKLSNLPDLVIKPNSKIPQSFKPYWDRVRQYDYEAIFAVSDLDELIPISEQARLTVIALAQMLKGYDWSTVRDDVLGNIFERFIPRNERILLGQFYTPTGVADLLVAFCIDKPGAVLLDPGCGSGTFLMRSYDYLRWMSKASHSDTLRRIWGFDISAFATELSVINLFRQDFSEFDNFPRVVCKSFFQLKPGDRVQFPPAQAVTIDAKVDEPIPQFDAVIGNPPYLRSQNQDDLSRQAKSALFDAAARNQVIAPSKTDLFAFFVYKSLEFLKPQGRLGFVTSSSWLTSESGATMQRVLSERFRPIAIVTSDVEPFFAHAEINTVLIIAERLSDKHRRPTEGHVAFVTLLKPIQEIFGNQSNYWQALQQFVDSIETSKNSWQDDKVRVHIEPITDTTVAGNQSGIEGNWLRLLRAPLSYFKVFGE
jgi:type I restriction-modification system DNA methylase subunit